MLNLSVDFLINYLSNLNSGEKIIVFLISWAVIWLPILLPILWFTQRQTSAPNPNLRKLTLILSLYSVAPFLTWGVIEVENISLPEIGIVWQASLFQSILLGYALSTATLVLIYSFQLRMGWLQWQQKPILNYHLAINLLPLLFVSFIIGSIEELIFRGVIVNFLAVDYGTWLIAIISSLIFALLHLIWEQRNTIPQLPGLWLMGLVLFYALIVDHGSLGLAIGLHSGWVLMLATVDSWEIFAYQDHFPGWLGGKKDQPLGSIIGVMVLVLTTIILWLMSQIAIA